MGKSRKFRRAKGPPARDAPPPDPAPAAQGQAPRPCELWYLALMTLVSLGLLTWALHEDMWSTSNGVYHGVFCDRNATGHRVPFDEMRAMAMMVMRAGMAVVLPLLVVHAALFLAGVSSRCLNVAAASATSFACVYYANMSGDEDMLLSHILAFWAVLPQLFVLALAP